MQPAVLAAVVTSSVSIVVAVVSVSLNFVNQSRLEELKDKLSGLAAERDARRSYEYDALKRLYAVTEPILFQLSERAEELQASISGLARTARNGDLDPDRNWLRKDDYYRLSTAHRMLGPVALFHLLQDGLTQVDLGLDPNTRAQYLISKYLAWALTDHHEFAAYEPRIPYHSDAVEIGSDAQVPRQGLASGIIDAAGESLIIRSEGGTAKVVRFGEFSDAYAARDSELYKACAPVVNMLNDFHPQTHPVLWRILIAQAHLCAACIATRDLAGTPGEQSDSPAIRPWLSIPESRRNVYDWRQPGDTTDDYHVLVEPFDVARQYLQARLNPNK